MKAFILAAGNGTRLRPLTDGMPKCLVPIGGVPMLQIWLNACEQYGISEVTINLHAHAALVQRFLGECRTTVRVRIFEEERLLGSAGTIRANRDWIGDHADFFVFYSDVLTTVNLARMYQFHHRTGQRATIGLCERSNPRACGIATLNADDVVTHFVEKPEVPEGNLAFSGVMIAMPQIIDEIPPESPADIGYHLLPRLVGRMAGYRISEYLSDIGTLKAYTEAQERWPGLSRAAAITDATNNVMEPALTTSRPGHAGGAQC